MEDQMEKQIHSQIRNREDHKKQETAGRSVGLVHVYCGDGKGKTTASIGLAVRAAGSDKKIVVKRFLKNDHSGEVEVLKQIPGITVLPCTRTFGFSWKMSQEEKEEAKEYYGEELEKAWKMALDQGTDMLVLDEAVGACGLGFIREERLLELIENKPEKLEVILTGRNPSKALLAAADYVTEMVMCAHPYNRGIPARKGIEY